VDGDLRVRLRGGTIECEASTRAAGGGKEMGGQVGIEGDSRNPVEADTGARPLQLIDDVQEDETDVAASPTLGQLLRTERERRQIGLDEVEQATHIRAAQLRAIEDDRLEALPAEAYARGFVRQYAEVLSINPDDAVRVFNEQWASLDRTRAEEQPLMRQPPVARASGSWRVGTAWVVAALLLLIVSAGVYLLGQSGSAHTVTPPPVTPPPHSTTATGGTGSAAGGSSSGGGTGTTKKLPATAAPSMVRLAIVASSSTCWIEARLGSAGGRLLGEQTLLPGQTARFHGHRIWLRLGAPSNVQLRLNGRAMPLNQTVPVNLLVTKRGLSAL
jgi:helix-turn-helix protein